MNRFPSNFRISLRSLVFVLRTKVLLIILLATALWTLLFLVFAASGAFFVSKTHSSSLIGVAIVFSWTIILLKLTWSLPGNILQALTSAYASQVFTGASSSLSESWQAVRQNRNALMATSALAGGLGVFSRLVAKSSRDILDPISLGTWKAGKSLVVPAIVVDSNGLSEAIIRVGEIIRKGYAESVLGNLLDPVFGPLAFLSLPISWLALISWSAFDSEHSAFVGLITLIVSLAFLFLLRQHLNMVTYTAIYLHGTRGVLPPFIKTTVTSSSPE